MTMARRKHIRSSESSECECDELQGPTTRTELEERRRDERDNVWGWTAKRGVKGKAKTADFERKLDLRHISTNNKITGKAVQGESLVRVLTWGKIRREVCNERHISWKAEKEMGISTVSRGARMR